MQILSFSLLYFSCKTLCSFQISRTTKHKIFVYEHDLCCIKLYLKNAKKLGNYFKVQILILLKCKIEMNNLQFLAIFWYFKKKFTSAKHQKLQTIFMYFFKLEEFFIMIAVLIYYASPISLIDLNKVFKDLL